jgi:4-amino-4-deoxy-L-arabinose transferase-like glycosyltransferase
VSDTARKLLAILAVALVLRLALWAWIGATDEHRFWDADTRSYHLPALALLELHEFAVSPERPGVAETNRTPGYPVFLAAAYAVFGEKAAVVALLQIGLGLATIALAFVIGDRRGGSQIGFWSALLLALDPVSLTFHEILMTESLFTFLISAAALVGLCASARRGWGMPAAVGLLIALATLVRPISYFLAPPVALLLGMRRGAKEGSVRGGVAATIATLVPVLLIVGGWQLRNYARTGHAQLSRVTGETILLSRGAGIVAWREGSSFLEARRELEAEMHPPGADRAEVARRQQERGFAIIRAHPWLFVLTEVRRAVRMMCGPGEHRLAWLLGNPTFDTPGLDLKRLSFAEFLGKWVSRPSWLLALFLFALGYLATVDLAILHWLWQSVRTRSIGADDVFLWTIIGYFLATGMASSRFRVPIMPFVSVYAAQGLVLWLRRRAERKGSRCGSPPSAPMVP